MIIKDIPILIRRNLCTKTDSQISTPPNCKGIWCLTRANVRVLIWQQVIRPDIGPIYENQ